MVEPSRPRSRLALAGIAVAITVGGLGFVAGKNTSPRPAIVAPAPIPVSTSTPAAEPAATIPTPLLGRADLLAAVNSTADAFAAGRQSPPDVTTLAGRRFELRLPFGCDGPAPDEAPLGWRYDERAETLRIRVTPVRFDSGWLAPEIAKGVDALEGFWIDRPWTTSYACPPDRPIVPTRTVPPERTVALAEFHGVEQSRAGRRDGGAYEAVEKVAPESAAFGQGFRVRLSGRIGTVPGSESPVLCRAAETLSTRPACVVAVVLDQVAIENPVTGATLATWEIAAVEPGP
jgi:hypothetical protein